MKSTCVTPAKSVTPIKMARPLPLPIKLNKEEKDILKHTLERAANKRFCGGSPDMDSLVDKGLMKDLGKVSFVPDNYYTITQEGEAALKGVSVES